MNEFKKYRKKPVVIEAKQMKRNFVVQTIEGTMKGQAGDYLTIPLCQRNL